MELQKHRSLQMLESRDICCPYCGEAFEALIDPSVPDQVYIEDCEICCRPIEFNVSVGDSILITVRQENE